MLGRRKPFSVFALLLLLVTTAAGASEEGVAHGGPTESGGPEQSNYFSVFVGVTDGGEAEGGGVEDAEGTLGLSYVRRLSPRWGIGALTDYAGGHRRELILAVPVVLQVQRATFLFAPGYERKTEQHEDEALFRVGFVYEFEAGRTTLGPAFDIDFVGGERVFVYGLEIGWDF